MLFIWETRKPNRLKIRHWRGTWKIMSLSNASLVEQSLWLFNGVVHRLFSGIYISWKFLWNVCTIPVTYIINCIEGSDEVCSDNSWCHSSISSRQVFLGIFFSLFLAWKSFWKCCLVGVIQINWERVKARWLAQELKALWCGESTLFWLVNKLNWSFTIGKVVHFSPLVNISSVDFTGCQGTEEIESSRSSLGHLMTIISVNRWK